MEFHKVRVGIIQLQQCICEEEYWAMRHMKSSKTSRYQAVKKSPTEMLSKNDSRVNQKVTVNLNRNMISLMSLVIQYDCCSVEEEATIACIVGGSSPNNSFVVDEEERILSKNTKGSRMECYLLLSIDFYTLESYSKLIVIS